MTRLLQMDHLIANNHAAEGIFPSLLHSLKMGSVMKRVMGVHGSTHTYIHRYIHTNLYSAKIVKRI